MKWKIYFHRDLVRKWQSRASLHNLQYLLIVEERDVEKIRQKCVRFLFIVSFQLSGWCYCLLTRNDLFLYYIWKPNQVCESCKTICTIYMLPTRGNERYAAYLLHILHTENIYMIMSECKYMWNMYHHVGFLTLQIFGNPSNLQSPTKQPKPIFSSHITLLPKSTLFPFHILNGRMTLEPWWVLLEATNSYLTPTTRHI